MPSSPADHHYLEQVLLSLGSWLLPRPSCFGDRVLLSICELGFGFLRLQGLGSSVVGSQADSVRQSMTPKFNSPSRVPALLQVPAVLSHDFVSSPKPFKSGIFSYFTNDEIDSERLNSISSPTGWVQKATLSIEGFFHDLPSVISTAWNTWH